MINLHKTQKLLLRELALMYYDSGEPMYEMFYSSRYARHIEILRDNKLVIGTHMPCIPGIIEVSLQITMKGLWIHYYKEIQ